MLLMEMKKVPSTAKPRLNHKKSKLHTYTHISHAPYVHSNNYSKLTAHDVTTLT